jgi:hypothetical protein
MKMEWKVLKESSKNPLPTNKQIIEFMEQEKQKEEMKGLLEKYPKAAKIVNEYYLAKLLESLNDKGLPDDFKEHVKQQGLPETQIVSLMEVNPYALVDVFDQNKIPIHIVVNSKLDDDRNVKSVTFGVIIAMGSNDMKTVTEWFPTRKEAEKVAIIEAFGILEEKLTK